MADRTYNIVVPDNETFQLGLVIKDDVGSVQDLTGYTAKMEIRVSPGSGVLVTASTANGKIILDGKAGKLSFIVPYSDLTALSGTYQYDLLITSPTSVVTLVIQGTFKVNDGITSP